MQQRFHDVIFQGLTATVLIWALVAPGHLAAEPASITVQVDKPSHAVPPTLWGIFFEDINCSADGGIYAELIRNRSLEDADKPEHWSLVTAGSGRGEMTVVTESPSDNSQVPSRNLRSLRLHVIQADGGNTVGVANNGYWGISIQQGARYNITLRARCSDGFSGSLLVTLEDVQGQPYARGEVSGVGATWKPFKLSLTPSASDPRARLVVRARQAGTVWLDLVSLFPVDTWKQHGLRPDLAGMLAALKPAFVRFPGGCWVEGDTMQWAYQWKETIGEVAQRRTHWNIWQYWATHGLGFHEYLQLCEDLGAEPLFVINCGMSHRENIPMEKMAPFVQDALDAIEYCNGPVTSRFGAWRAQHGHPEPFNLRYLEIGNENGGPAYHERWALFHTAVKARYPEIQLIANVWGDYPVQQRPDIVDEHYYSHPEFFMQQADRYDTYDRKGPKIYVGEYAVTQGCGQGNLRGAIGEAAFMTGLERNSDVVVMASYAPLFANVNYKKWNPDLICFDSSRVYGLPSYYVQKLFAENRGDVVLPVDVQAPVAQSSSPGGAIGVGTWMTQAEFKDIKVTRGDETLFAADFTQGTQGWKFLGNGDWKVQDGVLRQTRPEENIRAVAGDRKWTDYTYNLKARKLSGAEGFLILFRVQDENAKSWWNLGGWGNRRHAIEMGGIIGKEVPGAIETGRWYDIRIELNGPNVKCYLDDQLMHEVKYPSMKALYASATHDQSAGEVILKVVNVSERSQPTAIQLNGAGQVDRSAISIVLTSAQAADENSLDQPTKVAPVTSVLRDLGAKFNLEFPPNSLTLLRVKTN